MGVGVDWIDMADPGALESATSDATKMVWIETPTNPLLRVFDIEALSRMARAHGAMTVVDNTFATPLLQRPLALGADIVVHSMSKYLNGHSDVVAGAVITDPAEVSERLRFIQRAGGAVPSPFDCYLVARGIKTLPLRVARHCESALELAHLAARARAGVGRLLPWARRPPSARACRAADERVWRHAVLRSRWGHGRGPARSWTGWRFFSLAESLGGAESLVGQPALMSHASMPEEARRARGDRRRSGPGVRGARGRRGPPTRPESGA